MSELIKMRRDEPQHEGGPTSADVHPDEVASFLSADWQVVAADEPPVEPNGSESQSDKPKRNRKAAGKADEPPVEQS